MIQGQHIFLRAPEPEDIDNLYAWENDISLWHVSNTVMPFSRFTLEQYILDSGQDFFAARQLRLMMIPVTQPSSPAGCVDLFDYDPIHRRAGIGILVAANARRQGLAQEAIQLILDYAFNILQLHQVYCQVTADNTASITLFQQAGFMPSGIRKEWIRKGNAWLDEHFFQCINAMDSPATS